MEARQFVIDDLKNSVLHGHLIFTDAEETGESRGGVIVMTPATRPGVDIALMNAGFRFTRDGAVNGMFWMKKGDSEVLRYHPLRTNCIPMLQMASAQGMKTRIDLFCHEKTDAAYDIVNELLKTGYRVVAPSFKDSGGLFMIEPPNGASAAPIVKNIYK